MSAAPALCLLLLLGSAAGPNERPLFRVVTLEGRSYASPREPAVKKGYLFLSDGQDNFFSLPLDTVDWRATRAANLSLSPDLLDHWEEGPVRYLLSAEQVSEYRGAHEDAQRAAWISRFWGSMDPTPGTFLNEKRHEYWSRVQSANTLFTDSTKPGWKTDRGRIYILLGPPDEIEAYPSRSGNDARYDPRYTLDAPAGYPRHTIPPRGVARWIYRNPPGQGLDPNTVIAFREDPSGEYYLSTQGIDYDRIFLDATSSLFSLDDPARSFAAGGRRGVQLAEFKAQQGRLGTPAVSALALLSDLGRVQVEALEQDWLDALVSSHEYFGVFPLRSSFHFYRSQEGLTYAEINLRVETSAEQTGAGRKVPTRPAGAPPLTLSARLVSMADASRVVEFGAEDGFAALPDPDDPAGAWIFQSGAGVQPGAYTLLVGILSEGGGEAGAWREVVEVPDLASDGLLLSDLVLASRLDSLPDSPRGPYKQPFLHGHLRVVPDFDHTFHSGSELAFYYQVYGASPDPSTGKPSLDLLYRFERQEPEGLRPASAPLRLESQTDSSQAFAFALAGWPAGAYRLTVEVRDRQSGQSASRSADFKVRGD